MSETTDTKYADKLLDDLKKANAQAAKSRHARKELEAKVAELEAKYTETAKELEGLKATANQKPSELEAELKRVKGELATRDHRSAFQEQAKALGVKPEGLEAIWKLSDYQVGDTAPDAETIKATITKTLEANPFLRGEQPVENLRTLNPAPGANKGNTTGISGRKVVSYKDVTNPEWMHKNQGWFVKANNAGEVQMVP